MTSLMTATYVDDGVLGWDDRVVDIWPAFRTPTPALTENLRVRDLMGAATGLVEPGTYVLTLPGQTPLDTLRSLQYETVAAPPEREFIYNNTVYAVAVPDGGSYSAIPKRSVSPMMSAYRGSAHYPTAAM